MTEDSPKSRSGKSRGGFASMTKERRRELAAKGGKSVPAEKRSFAQDRELAAVAGRKRLQCDDPASRAFSNDHVSDIPSGDEGGNTRYNRAGKPDE
jgi:general stress protein YciG